MGIICNWETRSWPPLLHGCAATANSGEESAVVAAAGADSHQPDSLLLPLLPLPGKFSPVATGGEPLLLRHRTAVSFPLLLPPRRTREADSDAGNVVNIVTLIRESCKSVAILGQPFLPQMFKMLQVQFGHFVTFGRSSPET